MTLPFTAEQFYGVFRAYNESVWPAQPILLALAGVAITLAAVPRRGSGAAVSAILGFLWLWLGLAYHLAFFAAINPLAYVFAAASVAAGLVFVWQGVVKRRLEFRLSRRPRSITGLVLIGFALAVYPAWSIHAGHRYPELPTFGLPCPTTLFTVGMLAFMVPPFPRSTLVVPVLWSLVGAQAAFFLGVPQDLGLLIAAVVGAVLFVRARVPQRGDLAAR